jgi:hypothetical protein
MTLVLLAGLSAGVLQDTHGNIIPGRQVNVYSRGTSTPVQVYSDSAGASPTTQPLTTDSSGQVPGYVAGGVSIDIVDVLTGLREQGEPVSANAVARNIATAYLTPSGGDDSAAMVAALAAGGTIVMGPGTFLWNTSVPAFARSTPTRVVGAGIGKTTIKLSSGAPRAFDYGKVADYDVFTDIDISDFTVDANNIGGRHHVIVGTYVNNAQTSRISINNFTARRLRTINVPSDSTTTNQRPSLFNVPQVNTADTACTLNDHVYEDLDFTHGGNIGLTVGGTAAASPSNLTWDRIYIRRVRHDTGSIWGGPTGFSSANIQVGSQAPGGLAVIEDCYGANSGDVGIEVDNHSTLVISRTKIQDSFTCEYLFRNFAAPVDGAQKQTAVIADCEARVINQVLAEANSFQSTGWYLGNAADPQAGRFTFRDCKYINTTANLAFGAASTPSVGAAMHSTGLIYGIALERFKVIAENLSLTPADAQQPRIIALNHGGASTVRVKGLLIRLAGSKSGGAGTVSCRVFEPSSTAGGDDMTVHIEDYDLDMAVTGLSSGFGLLPGFQGAKMHGTIRRMRIISQGDANALSNYIFFNANPTLTPKILIADCDFTNGLTNSDISIPASQAPAIYLERNVWHTYPKPSVAVSSSNFNTGTFTSTTGNQYIGGYGATIQMTGGAGVTLIDLSKDGSTYDNVWTQASGVLTQTVQFHVDNGDRVKITFATTQPTVRVIPDK